MSQQTAQDSTSSADTCGAAMMTLQHKWLAQMAGTWTYTSTCVAGPDGEKHEMSGKETVRILGGLWAVGEMTGTTPGGPMTAQIALGYDPAKGKFIGSFVCSAMAAMFVYEGSLDPDRRVLTLDTEGPAMDGDGTMAYQDIVEIVDDDHRVMRSRMKGPDGEWIEFMRADYTRIG